MLSEIILVVNITLFSMLAESNLTNIIVLLLGEKGETITYTFLHPNLAGWNPF